MENWLYDKTTMNLVSGHYRTGESLPDELFQQVCKGRFDAGRHLYRKAQFLLFVRFRGRLLHATETRLRSSPVSPMWSECDVKEAVSPDFRVLLNSVKTYLY